LTLDDIRPKGHYQSVILPCRNLFFCLNQLMGDEVKFHQDLNLV